MPTVFDETPIFMTRLVVEVGGIMNGGAAQVGRDGVTASTRSCTSCREWRMSVPSLNSSSTDDSCGTDFERMTSRPSMPFSDCSSGMLTRVSTSAADSPRQIVWISTRGGANSGKASTGMSRSCCVPKTISAAPIATTRKRNFKLDPTIHRIRAGTSLRSRRHLSLPRSRRIRPPTARRLRGLRRLFRLAVRQ